MNFIKIINYLFGLFLILCIFSYFFNMKEGLNNMNPSEDENNNQENYNTYQNNAYMLAEKNSANIQYLKEQLDGINKIQSELKQLKSAVDLNTYNINQITTLAAKHATSLVGGSTSTPSPPAPKTN